MYLQISGLFNKKAMCVLTLMKKILNLIDKISIFHSHVPRDSRTSFFNESIHRRWIGGIKIPSFELDASFSFCRSLSSTVWHLKDRWEYRNTIGETAFTGTPFWWSPPISSGQTINLHCATAAWDYSIFLFIISPYHRYSSVLLADNYEPIVYLYL